MSMLKRFFIASFIVIITILAIGAIVFAILICNKYKIYYSETLELSSKLSTEPYFD